MIGLEQFNEAESILLTDWNLFQDKKATGKTHPNYVSRMQFRLSDSLSLLYEKWSQPTKSAEWKEISISLLPSPN